MKKQKSLLATPVQWRVLTRPMLRYPVERQLEQAKMRMPFNANATIFDARIPEDRMRWHTNCRPNEGLIVGRLEIIPGMRSKRTPKPAADLAEVLAAVSRDGFLLVEAESDTSNRDASWPERVKIAIKNVMVGRRQLSTEEARRIGASGVEAARRNSIVLWWKDPSRSKLHERYRAIWMSRAYANYEEALNAVNVALDEEDRPPIGSTATALRIFGDRGIRK